MYVWNQEYDLARREIEAWRAENPESKYPVSADHAFDAKKS
jgi:hypothetical protein